MLTKGSDLLLSFLTQFYQKNPAYLKLFEKIITGEYDISLRVIDWFITHYAKCHNIVYWIDDKNKIIYDDLINISPEYRKFHLYLDYRSQLKSYSKLHFDPFRRHERISFVIENKPLKAIETTVGQLNFFRWIFQNHILDYLINHKKQVEKEMSNEQNSKKNNNTKNNNTRNKTRNSKIIQNTFMQSQCYLNFD